MGAQIKSDDISTAHRLPPTRKTKDRIIVKFTRRETKDLLYSKRSQLKTKRTKDLPTVAAEPESPSISYKERIYVNESLTPYRKKLLGRIAEFKKRESYKSSGLLTGKFIYELMNIHILSRLLLMNNLKNFWRVKVCTK